MLQYPRALTILFGTETGNAAELAEFTFVAATRLGLTARTIDMATYNTFRLGAERDLLAIASTHGEGEPPPTAEDFFSFLDETEVHLARVRFGVLALGDSGYADFCAAGARLDRRFGELGAERLCPRRDIDVGELNAARQWITRFIELLTIPARP